MRDRKRTRVPGPGKEPATAQHGLRAAILVSIALGLSAAGAAFAAALLLQALGP
jgi:hypothetical protein